LKTACNFSLLVANALNELDGIEKPDRAQVDIL
jgi:hypothetical protein